MNSSEARCFDCERPEHEHPVLILTRGITAFNGYVEDGLITVDNREARVNLGGRSWVYSGVCQEFVGQKQLELF